MPGKTESTIWRRFGPGFLLAATSIGASHLVLSPTAGMHFGFSLLWLVVACHLFKYPAFEFGPRYAAATGKSLLSGYRRVPGPRNWALYVFLVGTVLQGVGVLSAVVSVSGNVIAVWTGTLTTAHYSLVIISLVLALLFIGGFSFLDNLNKVMMIILAVATAVAFFRIMPPASEARNLVIPQLPDGSIVLVAALLGWMPTGIDVSVWHSFWTLEKLKTLDIGDDKGRIGRLKTSLTDMRVGYGLSLVTGIMFMTLGAVHLAGQQNLASVGVARKLSETFAAILGVWMYHVFMLTAFFAMFSTSYTVVDGFSRSFSETISELRSGRNERLTRRLYLAFAIASSIFAAVIIGFGFKAALLVTAAALLSLAIAPGLYLLNIYCVSKHIEDASLKPAKATVIIAWAGVLFMIAALVATIYVKFVI